MGSRIIATTDGSVVVASVRVMRALRTVLSITLRRGHVQVAFIVALLRGLRSVSNVRRSMQGLRVTVMNHSPTSYSSATKDHGSMGESPRGG